MTRARGKLMASEADGRQAAGRLTPRELEVVRLTTQGLRNKEIARKLVLTEGTIKIHLHNVYRKTGVDSRVALTLWAQEKGLI